MVLILYYECYYFFYKFSQSLNYLTPRKIKIAFFWMEGVATNRVTWICKLKLTLYYFAAQGLTNLRSEEKKN